MALINATTVIEFILLGLSDDPKTQVILFPIFVLVYIIVLLGNILFITLYVTVNNLHTPMYFFLSNLSFLDLCLSSTTVPRMLKDLMAVKQVISYMECAAQMYLSLSFGAVECILLAIMAYDRYVAICAPLHYITMISEVVCIQIAVVTWISGFLLSATHIALALNVDICGNNVIDHFQCEVQGILSLSCENIMILDLIIFFTGVIVLMTPVTFIAVTYLKIILCIMKITSSDGRKKVFSTCGSHMIVVIIFYGSAMAAYMKPRSSSKPGIDKVIAIFYVIIPPMLNPLVYTLRNNDVKVIVVKLRNRHLP